MKTTKSIEQLENDYWQDTDFPTGLVERCYRYRKIPIGELEPSQLRTLIGQQIGLKYLMPLAIELLKQNILMEADLFEGDLLEAVLRVDIEFWQQHLDIKIKVQQLITSNSELIEGHHDIEYMQEVLSKTGFFVL